MAENLFRFTIDNYNYQVLIIINTYKYHLIKWTDHFILKTIVQKVLI